ncbi:hypothetical protein TNCV_3117331 [Trichonephila clavipes]|nr:hypothetical protein TNCV_3117331 [Trichonephila clavipes]
MKAIARSFVYWKNIDNDIEEAAKDCVDCARYKADPQNLKFITGNIPETLEPGIDFTSLPGFEKQEVPRIKLRSIISNSEIGNLECWRSSGYPSSGDRVQENIIPTYAPEISIIRRFEKNSSNIQHAETAEDIISKDPEQGNWVPSSVQGVPSTDVCEFQIPICSLS